MHICIHQLLFLFALVARNIRLSEAFVSFSISSPRDSSVVDMTKKAESPSSSDLITILGFGSLLSERSSRTTFPDLQNFRLGRVPNYRRVFGHPASIFFQRGIANIATKEMSSLSVEFSDGHPGFVCSIFEVPNNDMMADGVPSPAFLEREEEFDIIQARYIDFQSTDASKIEENVGILCAAYTDQGYLDRWGSDRFQENYGKYGIKSIWGWKRESGLKPCAVYLRHCYLAAKSMGAECFDSFLDETYLVDRKTSVREYLEQNPQVLETQPPPSLVERYSG